MKVLAAIQGTNFLVRRGRPLTAGVGAGTGIAPSNTGLVRDQCCFGRQCEVDAESAHLTPFVIPSFFTSLIEAVVLACGGLYAAFGTGAG